MLRAVREARQREKANRAAGKRQPFIYICDVLNRVLYSGIANAKELANSTCDSLGILALETVGNKSVDYEYNELNVYVWSIMTRFFWNAVYCSTDAAGGLVYEYLIPYDSREGPQHKEVS